MEDRQLPSSFPDGFDTRNPAERSPRPSDPPSLDMDHYQNEDSSFMNDGEEEDSEETDLSDDYEGGNFPYPRSSIFSRGKVKTKEDEVRVVQSEQEETPKIGTDPGGIIVIEDWEEAAGRCAKTTEDPPPGSERPHPRKDEEVYMVISPDNDGEGSQGGHLITINPRSADQSPDPTTHFLDPSQSNTQNNPAKLLHWKCFSETGELILYHKTVEAPYSCPQCGKTFVRKSSIGRHLKLHTGARPYSCPQCGKCFAHKCNLREHMATHEKEKAFPCPKCGKKFVRKTSVTRHLLQGSCTRETKMAASEDESQDPPCTYISL